MCTFEKDKNTCKILIEKICTKGKCKFCRTEKERLEDIERADKLFKENTGHEPSMRMQYVISHSKN